VAGALAVPELPHAASVSIDAATAPIAALASGFMLSSSLQ